MLYNATVTSVSAISSGINMAYKSYSDHYEKSQIESLRKGAKPPADILHAGTFLLSSCLRDSCLIPTERLFAPLDSSFALRMSKLEALKPKHRLPAGVLPAFDACCSPDAILLPRHGRLQQRSCSCCTEGCAEAGKASVASRFVSQQGGCLAQSSISRMRPPWSHKAHAYASQGSNRCVT